MKAVESELTVPFFRVDISEDEINEVAETLRSGWVTTGPRTKTFEKDLAKQVGARHAIALNSGTAALHLALEAVGVRRGDMIVMSTMTFAATAEVARYFDAVPVFVDSDDSLNIDPGLLDETLTALAEQRPVAGLKPPYGPVRAVVPMHYGGYCCDMARIGAIAAKHDVAVVEDAAHAYLSGYRPDPAASWRWAGTFGELGCFSFYANKCITTGEGGAAVTDSDAHAERMQLMSLHGMNRDAWKRFTAAGSWFYEIVAPGYKYNMTDVAAALGIHQLRRAEQFRAARERVAMRYNETFAGLDALQLPPHDPDTRRHSWHLYSIRLNPERTRFDRAGFIDALKERGVHCSVHWNPLHRMPYYRKTYGYRDGLFPIAERDWWRQVSLPIFPGQREAEIEHVCRTVTDLLG